MRSSLLLALALVAGCTAAPEGPRAPSDDRPLSAVTAALRPLDPCLLGATAGLNQVALGPHRCRFEGQGGADYLFLVVGAQFDQATRDAHEEIALDGARGYRRSLDTGCQVAIPVGADLAIRVTSETGRTSQRTQRNRCDDATAAAKTVVGRLARPESVSTDSRRDACDLLHRAAGNRLDGLELRFDEANYGLDNCQARRAVPGGWEQVYLVQLRYGRPAPSQDRLNGREVTITRARDCEYAWTAGPSGSPFPDLGDLVIRVRAPDCGTAAELAPAVLDTYRTDPPQVAPQRPIAVPGS
ncbi:hypothetical protein [Actinokineospora sp. NBRC 105648]|uniref:hypothetical protein n=1 Tax=Actinokineospora sp. NBRC 105648 TaxID=3032206 RepID=UPI0024A32E4A|nr:hypothetical protein [Actinokineospora sp. NBRC 105648]GLZ41337.1 hypothetical protein Acsp05_49610 [Actinokineospora sp. NBRC 105648]